MSGEELSKEDMLGKNCPFLGPNFQISQIMTDSTFYLFNQGEVEKLCKPFP